MPPDRRWVGDDPMPASPGLGPSPTHPDLNPDTHADESVPARGVRGAEADAFFARQRDRNEIARLAAERPTRDAATALAEPDPTLAHPLAGARHDAPTPTALLDAWARDCERARAVDAQTHRDVAEREASERARAAAATKRRRAEADRAEAARRRREIDWVEQWRKTHPDRVREAQRRWEQKNPERRRQASRDYYQRNKEKILARQKERHLADPSVRQKQQQEYREQHPDRVAAANRAWRTKPGNEKRHQEATQRWRHRERRRQETGLPPRRVHRRPGEDIQADARAADEFFGRDWAHRSIRDAHGYPIEYTPAAELDAWAADCARARLRYRLRNDPDYRDGIARRHDALHARLEAAERETARQARIDAIAREINDRLRITGPRRRPTGPDPSAPHRAPDTPTRPGLGR